MLLQEHVARLVQGKAPDGWEEETRWGVDESRVDEAHGSRLDKSSEARPRIVANQRNDAAGISRSGGDELEPEPETNRNDEG